MPGYPRTPASPGVPAASFAARSAAFPAAVFATLLAGCLGTESVPSKEWNGLALRTCGPADGPAVEFLMDTLPMACESPRAGAFRFYVDRLVLDSLPPAVSINQQPQVACDGKSDPVAEETRLDLTEGDSVGFKAHFRRIRTHPCTPENPRTDTLEGTGRLKKCGETTRPMCG